MRIGIITFHTANNYGAVLQCYALSEVLKDRGYDVELIDLALHDKPENFRTKLRGKIMSMAFDGFRTDFLPASTKPENKKEVYFFGSDQIWNLDITKSNFSLYFGSWIEDKTPKIAYAASFGNSQWVYPEQKNEVERLLKKFSSIGVRESSGREICTKEFNIESEKVLDPTLILEFEKYKSIYKKKKISNSMVCYIFGKEDKIEDIIKISDKKKMKPILLNDMRLRKKIKSIPFPTVSKWLSYLASSEFVITDSFHCMVFAILFNKNFIAIPAKPERVGRMKSLLKDLNLESRFFNSITDVTESMILNEEIDYDSVNEKLRVLKQNSILFIENSLKRING